MAKITIQFHASREEIVQIILPIVFTKLLHVVLLVRKNFVLYTFDAEKISNGGNNFFDDVMPSEHCEIFITSNIPIVNVSSRLEFYDKNKGGILIDVGELTGGELRQSLFSVETESKNFYDIAKLMSEKIKKGSSAGVWAINSASGAAVFIKSFRYTQGALSMERSGVKMKPFAGNNIIVLEKSMPRAT